MNLQKFAFIIIGLAFSWTAFAGEPFEVKQVPAEPEHTQPSIGEAMSPEGRPLTPSSMVETFENVKKVTSFSEMSHPAPEARQVGEQNDEKTPTSFISMEQLSRPK